MTRKPLVRCNQETTFMLAHQQELLGIGNNITQCLQTIKDTEGKAYDAKNLTGIFKGKKRDDALADAIILSAEIQNQTVTLIQEVVKLFLYCFKFQEDRNTERNEDIFNYIIDRTEDEETIEFLNELSEVFSSYKNSIRLNIDGICEQIGLADEKIINIQSIVDENTKRITATEKKTEEHALRLDASDERDNNQEAEMARQAQKDEEHDRLLKAGKEKDDEQDKRLAAQVEKDREHDFILQERVKKDQDQDLLIEQLVDRVVELENALNSIKLNQYGAKLGCVTLGIAIIAVLLSIAHFII